MSNKKFGLIELDLNNFFNLTWLKLLLVFIFLVITDVMKIKNINNLIENHMQIYDDYNNIESELKKLKQKKLSNKFLKLENNKLRKLINESIKSDEILLRSLTK